MVLSLLQFPFIVQGNVSQISVILNQDERLNFPSFVTLVQLRNHFIFTLTDTFFIISVINRNMLHN